MRMRSSSLCVLLLVFVGACFAQDRVRPSECPLEIAFATMPTAAELAAGSAAARDTRANEAVVAENLWQESQKLENSLARIPPKLKRISWGDARRMILRGYATVIVQTHDRTVRFVTTRGVGYVTEATYLDEALDLALAIDPCRVRTVLITE